MMKKMLVAMVILFGSLISSVVSAYEAGDILLRGGLYAVHPDDDNTTVKLNNADSPLSVSVGNNTQPGISVVYFLTHQWGIEAIAATPFTHEVKVHDPQGAAPGLLGVPIDGIKLAEVKQLPPTISALYYFNLDTAVKPYVGLGLNYTFFWDETFTDNAKSLGFSHLKLDSSLGLAAQIGIDFKINDKWSVNAIARYIDIDTDVNFKIGDAIKGTAEVKVDPMVYSLMIGYKF